MNNETKAQLQLLSDNMSNLNYDEILFRSDIWFCCKVFQKIYFSVKLRKKTERTE